MQKSGIRLVCRSHNPFSPSIALWQHFVLPNRFNVSQLRFSSTSSAVAPIPAPSAIDSEPSESNSHVNSQAPSIRFCADDGEVIEGDASNAPLQNPGRKTKGLPKKFPPRNLIGFDKVLARTKHTVFEEAEDYEGEPVGPRKVKNQVPDQDLPWASRRHEYGSSGMDRLAREIAKFSTYIKPDRYETIARRHLIEQVKSQTRAEIPNAALEIFGSERTGLAFATSDIDLRLFTNESEAQKEDTDAPPALAARRQLLQDLYHLQKALRASEAYNLCTVRYARYPLIALRDRKSGLEVQIVLSEDTSLSRKMIQKYMEEYPYLAELYAVVKTMFDVRGLSNVFMGGFGSYSILMMIIASLRHETPQRADAAGGLKSFLKFWAYFDPTTKGISIEPPILFNKDEVSVMTEITKMKLQESGKKIPPYLLCLRDPADPLNDLGRRGASIKYVQATCKKAYRVMMRTIKDNDKSNLLKPVVGPVYELNLEKRKWLAARGKKVLTEIQAS